MAVLGIQTCTQVLSFDKFLCNYGFGGSQQSSSFVGPLAAHMIHSCLIAVIRADTHWAESGGQEDLGQIIIQNADFHEGMTQSNTLTATFSFLLQITTDQTFHMRYTTQLWPISFIFISKLSQKILYDLFIFIIIINHLCIQFKKILKKWLPLLGFEPLPPRYAKKMRKCKKL